MVCGQGRQLVGSDLEKTKLCPYGSKGKEDQLSWWRFLSPLSLKMRVLLLIAEFLSEASGGVNIMAPGSSQGTSLSA